MKAIKYLGIILMIFGLSACTNDDYLDGIDEGLKRLHPSRLPLASLLTLVFL